MTLSRRAFLAVSVGRRRRRPRSRTAPRRARGCHPTHPRSTTGRRSGRCSGSPRRTSTSPASTSPPTRSRSGRRSSPGAWPSTRTRSWSSSAACSSLRRRTSQSARSARTSPRISAGGRRRSRSPRTPPRASRSSTTAFRSSLRRSVVTTHDHVSTTCRSIRLSTERNDASREVPLFDDASTATVDGIVGRVRAAIRPATRVLGITWVHSQHRDAAARAPIADAVAEANQGRDAAERVLLVVDGVHGLGAVDETVAGLAADFFCAGTHKWMFAPRGTGIVWAKAASPGPASGPLIPTFSDLELYDAWVDERPVTGPTNARRMSPGRLPRLRAPVGDAAPPSACTSRSAAPASRRASRSSTAAARTASPPFRGDAAHPARSRALRRHLLLRGRRHGAGRDRVKALLATPGHRQHQPLQHLCPALRGHLQHRGGGRSRRSEPFAPALLEGPSRASSQFPAGASGACRYRLGPHPQRGRALR